VDHVTQKKGVREEKSTLPSGNEKERDHEGMMALELKGKVQRKVQNKRKTKGMGLFETRGGWCETEGEREREREREKCATPVGADGS
jgi:hypothetical protein